MLIPRCRSSSRRCSSTCAGWCRTGPRGDRRRRGRRAGARRGDGTDASGNARLGDIPRLLQERIADDFAAHDEELNLKQLDPSYVIRSVPANPYDSVYCVRLAHAAVHAGMAGRTELVVGRFHGRFVHIPIRVATSRRSTVDPDGDLWLSVLESTGQPSHWRGSEAVEDEGRNGFGLALDLQRR